MYNVAGGTIEIVEYIIYYFGLLTFKISCF